MNEFTVVLIGTGGYGCNYVRDLAAYAKESGLKLVGAVDPFADKGACYSLLLDMNVPIYDTPEAFYQNSHADLAIIATPIQFHRPQAIYCMEHGSHVLLEKPIAATVTDAEAIIEARDRTGKILAVGFQWCYDPAMRALKKDIAAGVFGKPVSLKAIVLWPRTKDYYHRSSGWAGKNYTSDGAPIFDSVASNATAHYLMNMLWLTDTELTDVSARVNRANPIETYDTIVLSGHIGSGDLLYIASHAVDRKLDPTFEYRFEKGFIRFDSDTDELVGCMADGTRKNYGVTVFYTTGRMKKLWDTVNAIRGQGDIACTAEQALLHVKAIEKARELCPEALFFENIVDTGEQFQVPGLFEQLKQEYDAR